MSKVFYRRQGQAALSVILLIGGAMIAVGLTLLIVYISFINSSSSYQISQQTESTAVAGAEDGLMQLVRGKAPSSFSPYTVSLGSSAATVTITQNANGQAVITSVATIFGFLRTLQVIAAINSTTNQVTVISWKFI